MVIKSRETGYYWVFHLKEWKVGFWHQPNQQQGYWYFAGSMSQYLDSAMELIDENRFLSPAYEQRGRL